VDAGVTYHFQLVPLNPLGDGYLRFLVDVAPQPVANFGFQPTDPSIFDTVQFFDFSFDPGGVGFQSATWSFGDGATGTGCCPTHRYTADGDYTAQLTITTFDGRSAWATQAVHVRTHDVAITKLSAPQAASSGQTRQITVGVNTRRYPETVQVQLFKSVPNGLQLVGTLTQSVPVRPSNRTTDFGFSYTFSSDDAIVGKVTFKAVATVVGARDALPTDNEAIASPTKVNKS
jgi:PKD repeat protein